MSEDFEQSIDETTESSSPSETSSESGEAPAKAEASSESKPEVPFHEHPRFKELVQQKNEFAQRVQDYEKRLGELQSRMDKPQGPKTESDFDKLVKELKGIRPEFGTWVEQQEQARQQLEELRTWKQQQEVSNLRNETASTLDKLYTEHKIPEDSKQIYRALIKDIATSNPNLSPKDLPQVFKQVHDQVSKLFQTKERSTLANYATAKKADAKVPAPQKGQAPKSNSKFEYSKDREESKSQMVQRIMNLTRSQSDI